MRSTDSLWRWEISLPPMKNSDSLAFWDRIPWAIWPSEYIGGTGSGRNASRDGGGDNRGQRARSRWIVDYGSGGNGERWDNRRSLSQGRRGSSQQSLSDRALSTGHCRRTVSGLSSGHGNQSSIDRDDIWEQTIKTVKQSEWAFKCLSRMVRNRASGLTSSS